MSAASEGVAQLSKREKASSLTLAIQLMNALIMAGKLYEKVGYLGNTKVVLGINNIGGFELTGNPYLMQSNHSKLKGRNSFRIPREKYSALLVTQSQAIAKEIMDQLYNGFGRIQSDLFREDGKFIGI